MGNQKPPTPPFPGYKKSLEAEPAISGTQRDKPPTKETLDEQRQANRMKAKGESARARTDISIENLGERTKTRSYDKKTPELINGINLSDSPEVQQEKLDALRDVSVIMLATAYYYNADLDKKFDPTAFENVGLLGNELSATNLRPAENAALSKLRELASHGDSIVARQFKNEWHEIAGAAKRISRDINTAASFRPEQPLTNADKQGVKGFMSKYPKTRDTLMIGGAILGTAALGYGIYKLWKHFMGGDEKTTQVESPSTAPTSGKKKSWLGWAIGGTLAIVGLGSIYGWDKVINKIKEWGGSAKDAWDTLFGENPEYNKNKAMYEKMANRINSQQRPLVPVKPEFLAKLCAETKYNDFKDKSIWESTQEYIQDFLAKNKTATGVAGGLASGVAAARFLGPTAGLAAGLAVGGGLPMLVAGNPEEREQANAVRAYLGSTENEAAISGIRTNSETTLAEVLVKLDNRLEGKTGNNNAPQAAEASQKGVGQTPETVTQNTESFLITFLGANYGAEIAKEDLDKIMRVSYRDFMAWKKARGFIDSLNTIVHKVSAEAKGATALTASEERLLNSENLMRKFFMDNEALLKSMHLPESLATGATVGEVMDVIAKANKFDALKKKEIVSDLETAVISDDEIEGTAARDEAAKKLPEATWNIYIGQRKVLREMLDSGEYVKNNDANKMIAATKEMIQKLAKPEIDKSKRDNMRRLARELNIKLTKLELALDERNQKMQNYTIAIQNGASTEELHKTFLEMTAKNNDLTNTYAGIEKDLTNELQWRSIGVAALLKGIRVAYYHIRAPKVYKAWVEQYYGRFYIPHAMIKRINQKFSRPSAGLALLDKQIEEGERRLTGDLGENLKNRARIFDDKAPTLSDAEIARIPDTDDKYRIAVRRYKSEKQLLEHDRQLRGLEEEVSSLENNATALRKQPASPATAAKLKAIEEEIAKKMPNLKEMRLKRIKLSKTAMEHAAEDFYANANPKEGALKPNEFEQLDDLARRTSEHNREAMRAGESIYEELRLAAKKGDAKEVARLQKLFNETIAEIPKTQKGGIKRFFGFIGKMLKERKNIARGAVRGTLDPQEKKNFRSIFSHFLYWQKEAANSKATKGEGSMLRVAGKKLRFFSLAIGGGLAAAGAIATKDERTGYLPAIGHMAFDIAPGTGEFSDYYAIRHGKEIFTGRKIGNMERFLFRPIFGVVGLASDLLLVLSIGAAAPIRAGVSGLKGAYVSAKMANLAEKVAAESIAKKAGEKAAEKLSVKAVTKEAMEGAEKAAAKGAIKEGAEAAAEAGAKVTAEEEGKFRTVLERIQKHGIAAGIGLGIGTLAMSLVQTDEMDITPEMDEIAGGADGKIDDIEMEYTPEATQAAA